MCQNLQEYVSEDFNGLVGSCIYIGVCEKRNMICQKLHMNLPEAAYKFFEKFILDLSKMHVDF